MSDIPLLCLLVWLPSSRNSRPLLRDWTLEASSLAASDTDRLPSAYLDGKFGPAAGLDQLSAIRLDRSASQFRLAPVPVSNSVVGPPTCVAVTQTVTPKPGQHPRALPSVPTAIGFHLKRSAYGINDPHQGFFSSLPLLRLNRATGTLDRVGDFPFDGMLPEAPVFDNSSHFIAVTNFAFFDASPHPGGFIDLWRIATDYADPHRVELVETATSIPVVRSPQSMAIVR